MILYRRHSNSFEAKISASGATFVPDSSRRYNKDGCKNSASIFFYSLTEEGANEYTQYDDDGNEVETSLYVYEVSGCNLLDLRDKDNRQLLRALIEELYKKELSDAQSAVVQYSLECEKARQYIAKPKGCSFTGKKQAKEYLKRFESMYEEAKLFADRYTTFDVVDDRRYSGLSLWGQRASDYGNGDILKRELLALGYDGFLFSEGEGRPVEIGLLNPARKIEKQ